MHVSLSDLLVCPRCGPEWGLILMPEAVRDRRVVTGSLGCPSCRSRYAIRSGVAELALEGIPASGGAWRSEDGAVRLAALLGLGDRPGVVVVAGPAGVHARALVELLERVEVVVGEPPGTAASEAGSGEDGEAGPAGIAPVSRIELGRTIPLRSAGVSGVALTGGAASLAGEGARVLAPGARILVDPADAGARAALAGAGLRVLAEEGSAVLASR